MANFDPKSIGAIAIDQGNTFDPASIGAVPVDQNIDQFIQPTQKLSYGENVANVGRGYAKGLTALPYGVANLVGINVKQPQWMEPKDNAGIPYSAGELAGTITNYALGGAALKGILGAAEAAPVVGRVAKAMVDYTPEAAAKLPWLKTIAPTLGRSAITGATVGGLSADEGNRGMAALAGGVGAPAAEFGLRGTGKALGAVGKGVKNIFAPTTEKEVANTIQATEQSAKDILDYLGKGKNYDENIKSLADDFIAAKDYKKNTFKSMINPVFEKVGSTPVENSSYLSMDPNKLKVIRDLIPSSKEEIEDVLGKSFKKGKEDLEKAFIKNPTVENAHWLNSVLKTAQRGIKTPGVADKTANNILNEAIDNLSDDIYKTVPEKYSSQYTDALQFYRKNVVPFYENRVLSKVVEGEAFNPQSLINKLKNPNIAQDERNFLSKIISDLPEESRNKIIYHELVKNPNLKPEKLYEKLNKLDSSGFGDYVKNIYGLKDKLEESISAKSLAKDALKESKKSISTLKKAAIGAGIVGLVPTSLLGIKHLLE